MFICRTTTNSLSHQITIYKTAHDITSSAWNVHDYSLPLSSSLEYLRLIEDLHRDTIEFHYAVIEENGHTIGVLAFQNIVFEGSYINNFLRTEAHTGWFKKILFALLRRFFDTQRWNLLQTGNIYFTGERGVHFSPAIPVERIVLIIAECFEQVAQRGIRKVHAYMMNNVYDDDVPYIHQYLKAYKYAKYPVDPDMFMSFDPDWDEFDDYMRALTSKYRVRIRKVLKTSAEVKTRLITCEEIKTMNDSLYQLYLNTANKVDFNLGYLAPTYFSRMTEMCGDEFKVLGYFLGDRMIGFMSIWIMDEEMDVNYMGMDYEVTGNYSLYNRMLVDLVRLGIDIKATKMHLGRTASEIKSTVGAEGHDMHIYLGSPVGWRSKGMRFFESYFGSPKYTLRHPFKNKPTKA